MSIDINEFDFGFTAVDESELEAVQKAATKVESTSSKVEETEEKLKEAPPRHSFTIGSARPRVATLGLLRLSWSPRPS